jgi:hypothetical protein
LKKEWLSFFTSVGLLRNSVLSPPVGLLLDARDGAADLDEHVLPVAREEQRRLQAALPTAKYTARSSSTRIKGRQGETHIGDALSDRWLGRGWRRDEKREGIRRMREVKGGRRSPC